jgi:hypothetical protein
MSDKRIILIEFNELCPRLLDRWMSEGRLPNFKRFHDASHVFVSESDEPKAPNLEPWIQWYSIHTGLSYQQHRVFRLTDGVSAEFDDLWQLLLREGRPVWNCSSMNARGFRQAGSAFLPDPWCITEKPYPDELGAFYRVVADRVQEYTNRDKPVRVADVARFAAFMATHGLSWRTAWAIARQLGSELLHPRRSWKRAVLLDKLLFDVFASYFRKLRPHFATFFLNSTAHYQHAYWRNMEPEVFANRDPEDENEEYRDAILFGYQQMDALLGDFFQLEREGATLILTTALSQQPFLKWEHVGGQRFFRPRDVAQLLGALGITYEKVAPVMTHQYIVTFASAEQRTRAEATLKNVWCHGEPVFYVGGSAGELETYLGNQIRTPVPADARLEVRGEVTTTLPYYDLFYEIGETKSGFHHPDGALWFKTGDHAVHREKVSILDIAPTVLGQLGVRADWRDGQRRGGRDLSALLGAARRGGSVAVAV